MLRHRSPPTLLLALRDRAAGADLARAASRLGWEAEGPYPTAAEVLSYLEDDRPDFAVVDTVLGDGTAVPLVSALRRLSLPFVLVDGLDAEAARLRVLARSGQGWAEVPLAELLASAGPAPSRAPLPHDALRPAQARGRAGILSRP